MYLLQLVWLSPSCSIASSALYHGPDIYLPFHFLLILLCGLPGRQRPLFSRFSFLFLTITRSGHLAEVRWSICISKSQTSLCISFSRINLGLCIYHLFVWSNLNFLHNSQWITFPTLSYLVLYSFCDNLLHLLIIWLIVWSLSPHNLHLQFLLWYSLSLRCFMLLLCGKRNLSHSKCAQICLSCKVRLGGGETGDWGDQTPILPIVNRVGLPMHWWACKLPHCVIDPDVAFWYHYLSPAWMQGIGETFLSLGEAWQETSLDVGLLKKIVAGKKEFIGRSYHFQCRNSAVHLLLRRRWHSNSTWNWFYVFSYERLFSFCYWQGILSTIPLLSETVLYQSHNSILTY